MKQLFHIILLSLILVFGSCKMDTFRGAGQYKKNKNQKKNDNYLESEAGKVVEKSKKRNKKEESKKIKKHKKSQEEEVEKAEDAKKQTNKKKKKNTGQFLFY